MGTVVEDAATIWVREVPSHACSEELQQFLEMEKQMNYYFNNRQLYNYQHASHITIGHPVVVCYKDCWRRGKVEKLPEAKGEKTSVFLVDYGFMCQTSLVALIPLNEGEWTSVPCQARKVVLHGVLPISLQYVFINQEFKLTLNVCPSENLRQNFTLAYRSSPNTKTTKKSSLNWVCPSMLLMVGTAVSQCNS
ncbi:hypothetical protein E2C01_017135 [Portunus trituberculatus]|uniref:Tudor domain-containing protein n=1 Tax=Portunus trituberculatus TaxID=210409 RepID=A0A5B7DQS7_PORTR|nr:hypothetical protein [Portunus trituberculatus]